MSEYEFIAVVGTGAIIGTLLGWTLVIVVMFAFWLLRITVSSLIGLYFLLEEKFRGTTPNSETYDKNR